MKYLTSLLILLFCSGPACTLVVDADSYRLVKDTGPQGDLDAGDGGIGADAAADMDAMDTTDSGPGDGPADTGAGDLDLATVVSELASWACINVSRCEGRLGADVARPLLMRLCHPAAIERRYLTPWRKAIDKGEMAFDSTKAAACLRALAGDAVDCDADLLASTVPDCEGVLNGLLEADAACTRDEQCSAGLICVGNSPQCSGHCATPGEQGTACVDSGDCASTFGCLDGICVARSGDGLPCDSDEGCREGLYCTPGGKCAAQAADGEGCESKQPSSCVAPLICMTLTDGAVCGSGSGLGEACSAANPCELKSRCDTSTGRCVPAASPGAKCNAHAQCPDGLYCAAGTCTPGPVVGEDCDLEAIMAGETEQECIEGYCVDNKCGLGGDGTACVLDLQSPFTKCNGFCSVPSASAGDSGMCTGARKIIGDLCLGDYECVEGLVCEPIDAMDTASALSCQAAQCG
ncbi:MAG: EB domain-containing protein [Myxococcales bacterium]|nr:EB domain-containing protein [Myxococcales bacterium]